MELGGNRKVNSIFEAKWTTTSATKPGPNTGRDTRDRFIRIKYVKRRYFSSRAYYFNAEQDIDDGDQQQRDVDTSSSRSPDKELSVPCQIRSASSKKTRRTKELSIKPPIASKNTDLKLPANRMLLGKYRRKERATILNQDVESVHQQRQQYALDTSPLRNYDLHHAGVVSPLSRRDRNKSRASGDRNDGTGSLNKLFRSFRAQPSNETAELSAKKPRGRASSSTGNNSDDDSVNQHFQRYRTTAHSPSPPLPTFGSLPWPPWLPG
jgi:hypothetical protein